MTVRLSYGDDAAVSLDLGEDALVANCQRDLGAPLGELGPAVASALAAPLDYPPLAQCIVPGDKIVLALEPGVPRAAELVEALVEYLGTVGVGPADITLLGAGSRVEDDPAQLVPAVARGAMQTARHDPADRRQLSYLAATPKGRPVYLNRALCDADVVIPIGCLRCNDAWGYLGGFSGLYPTFSDAKTLQRFRHPEAVEAHTEIHARAQHEVERVGWLAGTPLVVQVLPGRDGSVLGLYAGAAEAVFRAGGERATAVWHYEVPRRASLVVAALSGGPLQQTWDNVGRALATAIRLIDDNGAIALCTELTTAPGAAVRSLSGGRDPFEALRRIERHREPDAVAGRAVARALSQARLFVLSGLDEELVEDLGMASVAAPEEIARLAKRHPSCILLPDAQYTVASVCDE
jgi:nickel-dependent lactate racemase